MSTPHLGGTHPIFGIFLGGDDLTNNYKLASSITHTSTSQLRSERSLNIAETNLHNQQADLTPAQFSACS